MNLTILINNETCPQDSPFTQHFCYEDTVNISNMLENFGNINVTGNLTHRIFNATGSIVNQDDWTNLNVSMHEIVYINTPYDIKDEDIGIFTITGNYSYDGNYSSDNCEFEVWKGIGNLLASENKFLFFIPPGKSRISDPPLKLRLYRACDNTIVKMNKSSVVPGNWTSFNPEEIFLSPTSEENTTINVTVPIDTDLGAYYGWIYANADGQQIPINLTVVVTVIDFYIKTRIPEDKKEVCLGSQVYAEVNITKVAPVGQVDFNMTYQLLYKGNVIAEIRENLTLNDTFNSMIRIPILTVPFNAPTGNYTFLSHLEHDQVFYESADTFEVTNCEKPKPPEEGGGGGGAIAPSAGPSPKKQLILNLSTNLILVTTGNRTSFVTTVENIGNTVVQDVKISIEGLSLDWIETIPLIVAIPAKGIQGYLVIINVPSDAKSGVYKLKVQATDDVESNSENLTLIIGTNIKEIADLMLVEYQKLFKEATQSLLVEDCMDITFIKIIHNDAQLAFQKGLEEYEKKKYTQAINWFEYAIPLEQKVIARVDINIEMELLASNSSKIIIPPFYEPEEQFIQAQAYLEGKNYEEVCDPIEEIRKFILVGLIFWPGIVILIVLVIVVLVFFYRYKRRRERYRILGEVRERLISES